MSFSPGSSATAELEHLLSIAPPTLDTAHHNNPVAVVHAALESLRDSGDANFLFLRTVIESNTSFRPHQEELIFHCLTGLRQVTLWQWKRYSAEFLNGLRDYLMVLGHGASSSRTVRLACYTTSVSFWKRGWNAECHKEYPLQPAERALLEAMKAARFPSLQSKHDLFQYLEVLFHSQPAQIEHAATFLTCLVTEVSGKSAVSYRLPLEFHKEAHKSFEKDGPLTQCLKLSMAALSHAVNTILAQSVQISTEIVSVAAAAVQLTSECLNWEFGLSAWDYGPIGTASNVKTLLRPPTEWHEWLAQPDFVRAIFRVHEAIYQQHGSLAHHLRQLLLQLASLSSSIFNDELESQHYASHMLEGVTKLLNSSTANSNMELLESSALLDTLQLMSRLLGNFRLASLIQIPALVPLLQRVTAIGEQALSDQETECDEARGDFESMVNREWREEVLAVLLEGAVILAGDPWILYSGTEESRRQAQSQLSAILGPLYESFIQCRTRMAALQEHYMLTHETELDEVREEIEGTDLEDELAAVSIVGRLNLSSAIACLSSHFTRTMPQLQGFWEKTGDVTPEIAALLEQCRLLSMYISHLLTDDNEGETPAIPDAVIISCSSDQNLSADIAAAVQALVKFADAQVNKIAQEPSNARLSPLLAVSFLQFLTRWAPAYVYPADYGGSPTAAQNRIMQVWSTKESAQQVLSFCVHVCLFYQCFWPHENHVQLKAANLLLALAMRGEQLRSLIVSAPAFLQIVQVHSLTAGVRHSASQSEFESIVASKASEMQTLSMEMVSGFRRLPYREKSRILTVILVVCGDSEDHTSTALLAESLRVVRESFSALIHALSSNEVVPDDVNAKEMACLCVDLFDGVARAGDMKQPERIPFFISTHLAQLSGLMSCFAADLSVCESLLRLFCDYTEHFIAVLDRDQSFALFNSSAQLLQLYSVHHCKKRKIKARTSAETEAAEDQSYGDILMAIQLLTNLGTKDFIDTCADTKDGIESTQVTDVIFFGLQQILPLMSQGLLQLPILCSHFFELVGFMMDTYPEKVCTLPFELFDSLVESLLFGMSHHNSNVARSSLQGIGSVVREHIKSKALQAHLSNHPDLLDRISRRLLTDVVFQSLVVDRVESAGMALLPLAAAQINRFAAVVTDLTNQISDSNQRSRLQAAFTSLIQPEVLEKVLLSGYEGRMNRIRFKESFQGFVSEIHSFLTTK
jgi:hypothetical protein